MLTFEQFVRKYLNKRNPKTFMYWLCTDVAADAGVSEDLIIRYVEYAQRANLNFVMATGRVFPDDQMIAYWKADPNAV